ncbi:hypothetical protein NQZ68_010688 [Dissostichus eleginoides]|nr:hypothetical protein NQZ68_010688 [Dissostichus eleginoides]
MGKEAYVRIFVHWLRQLLTGHSHKNEVNKLHGEIFESMASTQQNAAISDISPVLFLTVEGEPMSFFLRPGPVKCKLQPLIAAGGGTLSNVQRPGAILLIDPEENGSIPETTAHCYVSTQYIHDCIEKEEQLNLKDYRLNPEVSLRQSPRLNKTPRRLSGVGRIAYTAEDDAAISSYVSKHQKEVGGNRIWLEMETQLVTNHSWQSMKSHYKVQLANKHPEVLEVKAEEATKSVEGDFKIDAQPIPAEDTQPESPKSISPEKEVQLENPQSDEHPAESTLVETVEAETNPPQPEGPCLDPHTDAQPIPSERTETTTSPQKEVQLTNPQMDESTLVETVEAETSNPPEAEGPCLDPHTDAQPIQAESMETIISPEKKMVPEDSPPAQPESLPGTPLQKKPKEKQKASPKPQQPQRRPTRWHLVLEGSPEPYGEKLRSATSSRRYGSPPQLSKKSKFPTKSAPKKDKMVEQPPSKKARGTSVTAVPEEPQEESAQAPVSETAPTDAESNSVPQEVEKKKEKRKLGILELAIKEFEDESESNEDVAPDLQNPSETPTIQPPATEPPPPLQTQPPHCPTLSMEPTSRRTRQTPRPPAATAPQRPAALNLQQLRGSAPPPKPTCSYSTVKLRRRRTLSLSLVPEEKLHLDQRQR